VASVGFLRFPNSMKTFGTGELRLDLPTFGPTGTANGPAPQRVVRKRPANVP